MRYINNLWHIGLCLLLTSSCGDSLFDITDPTQHDILDRDNQLSREDYKNIHAPQGKTNTDTLIEPPVPDLAEILAAPKPPKIGETQLVSVAVTDDVPLKDVLIELARLANVDIEVDAGITGGVSFRAKDRPFNEVIERIADLAGLRYRMKDNVLRVERDAPYVMIYPIDFLNMERSSSGSLSINTSVLSSGVGGGGGGGLNSGSSAAIKTSNDSDFWKQFEAGLKQILAYVAQSRVSSIGIASQPIPADQAGMVFSDPAAAEGGGTAAPATPGAVAASGGGSGQSFYILNRQAGTLTVSATQKQHELLQEFLRKITANSSAQVLIESKIVEVTLKDQFQSGIDWSKLGNSTFSAPFKFGGVTSPDNFLAFNFNADGIAGTGIDLEAAVKLTEIFGTTRTLSSPRLHATNNQQAVLTFAENHVYFELKVETQTTTTTAGPSTDRDITSTIHTVPIGIILALQPSINTETNEVTLSVRPTLSRIVSEVVDPASAVLAADVDSADIASTLINRVPIVEVRELDSILKLKSGQVMVIGGLMEDKKINDDSGVPGLSRVPMVGNLFRGINRDHEVKELVIFIRATVVGSGGNSAPADKRFYEKFTNDPRPLSF